MHKTIQLKNETKLTTGYTGRGIKSESITLPAGTAVQYCKQVTGAGTYHTVSYQKDGKRFEASVKV